MLKQLVKESLANELLPAPAPELVKYTQEVEDLIQDTVDKVEKLHEKGKKLLTSDVLTSPVIQERNRLLLLVIGFLKTLQNRLSSSSVELRKMF